MLVHDVSMSWKDFLLLFAFTDRKEEGNRGEEENSSLFVSGVDIGVRRIGIPLLPALGVEGVGIEFSFIEREMLASRSSYSCNEGIGLSAFTREGVGGFGFPTLDDRKRSFVVDLDGVVVDLPVGVETPNCFFALFAALGDHVRDSNGVP